ncbi:MAG: sigma 54-interacting transcriptional regulator [Acidobacteriia bacterium]|nr:sigma 54-interacting transcriptional regulator [Terriglobia bacterium]
MSSSALQLSDTTYARYEALLKISESIALHRKLSPLFADLYHCLKPLINFDFIGMCLYDPEREVTRLHELVAEIPVNCPAPRERPLHETPAHIVIETQQPYYVGDVQQDGRYPAFYQVLASNGIHAHCVLPLSTAQRRIGTLNFGSRGCDAYSAGDIDFMAQVAKQVAVAVDNALNHEAAAVYEQQLARERDSLRLLLELNNAVVTNLEAGELFRAISACLKSTFGMEYASLALYDAESNSFRLQALDFPASRGLIRENAVLPVDGSPSGYVLKTGMPKLFTPADIEALSPEAAKYLFGEGLRSFVSLPLISRQRTLGTINLGARREDLFSPEDVAMLAQAAGQIAIAVDNALSYRRIEELNAQLAEEKVYLEDEIRTEHQFSEIIGRSKALKVILKQIETVAPTDSTVLIFGETGTGKELVARALHGLSGRRQGTFVKLNCAAIPTGLLESEMFGHEKGAFTGAIAQRIGRFELAHKGTVFLDEVGEIPLELQSKLLRVLQEREFERLGSSRTLRTDARVIAATNRDLEHRVQENQFRSDLYYRLNVFPITVPPLRERPEDVPMLVRYFVQQFARRMSKNIITISAEDMRALVRYPWPGNIRELQNLVERAVILSTGPVLAIPSGELEKATPAAASTVPASPSPDVITLEAAERQTILRALQHSGGRVSGPKGAATALGMKRTTLQARMHKLGINPRERAVS